MNIPRDFHRIVLSGAKSENGASKIIARPILLKGARKIQIEEFVGTKAFHKNLDAAAAEKHLTRRARDFKNINVIRGQANGKKNADMTHDRPKNHVLLDGVVCPPLVKLGIMGDDGRVFKTKMDKFVQINSFLRILGDAVKNLPADKELEIVDFCCGKSYLTFVADYFFAKILNRRARITGIDTKSDVIGKCACIGRDLSLENLNLIAGDINDFNPENKIDVALSLHACDTATDIVLRKAALLGAAVILSVPCCHKQTAGQIENKELDFILKYGLLKDRFSAILTDALRANWLENQGYKVDVLEFVDYGNSPKNVMIRAIKTNKKADNDLKETAEKFGIAPELLK
jgi:trans-aconitate methyltransferase